MKAQANKLFEEAVEKLNQAREELYRPQEDLVSYLVCKNAQSSIENFLRGYLLQKEINTDDYQTISALFEKCKSVNKNFEEVNLSEFNCKSESTDSRYCTDVPKVCNCLNVSASLESLLRQEKVIA